MLTNIKNVRPLLCASVVSIFDVLLDDNDKNGLERLNESFSLRSFGSSKEIKFILTSTSAVFIASSMFGSIAYSKDALEFFQKYINKYKTFYEFKVEREAYVVSKLAKGSITWGCLGGALTFASCTLITVANAYRGKPGIIEYAVSGALCGSSLTWFFIGTTSAINGGILGFLAGAVTGAAIIACVHYEKRKRRSLPWQNKNLNAK